MGEGRYQKAQAGEGRYQESKWWEGDRFQGMQVPWGAGRGGTTEGRG